MVEEFKENQNLIWCTTSNSCVDNGQPVFKSALSKIEQEIFIEYEYDRYGDKYAPKPVRMPSMSACTYTFVFEQVFGFIEL